MTSGKVDLRHIATRLLCKINSPPLATKGRPMSKSVVVLGTLHQLQGDKFTGYTNDPSYSMLVQNLIDSEKIDFVFEEASGRVPSIAGKLAEPWGSPRYLDIDPPRTERSKYGIAEDTEDCSPIHVFDSPETYCELIVDEHRKREELWLRRLRETEFERGLVICGIGHGLSFAFRLQSAGLPVKLFHYMPNHLVCKVCKQDGRI
ncbi:MAG: hypothetical protein ACRD4C_15235 [Candidatus Acidiferrales bacterium]